MRIITLLTSILCLAFTHQLLAGESDVEIPLLKLQKTHWNESMPSSTAGLLMRQYEYQSSASVDELLAFYKQSAYVDSCKYDATGENHQCILKQHGKIHSGKIFIDPKSKNGLTTVLADYFYLQ